MRTFQYLLTAAVIVGCSEPATKPATIAPTSAPFPTAHLVPAPFSLQNLLTNTVETDLPLVNDKILGYAQSLARTMAHKGIMKHPDDALILKLMGEYDRQRPMKVGWKALYLDQSGKFTKVPQKGEMVMLYSCMDDGYMVNPTIRLGYANLASAMYHELMHEIQCRELIKKYGVRSGKELPPGGAPRPCEMEARGYAAQIRMLVALNATKPRGFRDPMNRKDLQLLAQMHETWEALADNRFCEWFERRLLR